MNVRQFIAEIEKRTPLWDQQDTNYHNKRVLAYLWREVAEIFNTEVPTAKTKWKNLRDTFRVELKKTKKWEKTQTLDSPSKSLWTYYDDMLFIKDVLKTRKLLDLAEPSSSISEDIPTESIVKTEPELLIERHIVDVDEDDNYDDKSARDSPHSLHFEDEKVDSTDTYQSKRKRPCDEHHPESDDEPDDDLLFFRSLLPFTKKLNPNKKLLFRMNVQQALYNGLYN